jgi:hypothetical protein
LARRLRQPVDDDRVDSPVLALLNIVED